MNQTKKLVLSALFAALICVATFTIRIPIVATNGYIHLGDALVILAGIFLSPASAFLAAGIGSCLADLFGGYIIYVPATFFIKGIIAFLGSILFHKMIAKSQSKQMAILLCGVLDLVLVVLGYALYETILYGMKMLERWTGKAWFTKNGAFIHSDEECELKGKELLTSSPETVGTLFVSGEMMERGKRPVRILKTARAWNSYRDMLLFYGVKTIAGYLDKYGIHYEYFAAQVPAQVNLAWINMGGQLVPEEKADALRASIRQGLLPSWNEIHSQYDVWWNAYPRDKAENAYEVLRKLTGVRNITAEMWNDLIDSAKDIRKYIEEQVLLTKKKDYDNPYRLTTYRNTGERNAVIGKLEDNKFIGTAKEETREFIDMLDRVRA